MKVKKTSSRHPHKAFGRYKRRAPDLAYGHMTNQDLREAAALARRDRVYFDPASIDRQDARRNRAREFRNRNRLPAILEAPSSPPPRGWEPEPHLHRYWPYKRRNVRIRDTVQMMRNLASEGSLEM